MDEQEALDFHKMMEKVEGLLIPQVWIYNICDPDPSIPFSEEDEIGVIIGSMLASMFRLYGFPKDAANMGPMLSKLVDDQIQVQLDKTKLMKSIGVTSKEKIEQALDRAVRWSLITIHKRDGKLYCSLNKESIDMEHCNKMRKLTMEKLNAYEMNNPE